MTAGPDRQPNFYESGGLDRLSHLRGDADWLAQRLRDPATRILPVWRTQNLIVAGTAPVAAALSVSTATEFMTSASELTFLGLIDSAACFAIEVSHLEDPTPVAGLVSDASFTDLRAVGPLIGHADGALLAYARGLTYWHSRHRFCGVCGHPTESIEAGHQRRCTNAGCGALHFPRTDPAVIMLIHDGERILLGRQAQWPPGMHSVLAGFVEPGESLEDAVRREVFEEVGIAIDQVRYHSSQPWPFPSSIMLGFTARAMTTALRLATDELDRADWYSREQLLQSPENEIFRLPRRDSIARRLVEDWLAGA